MITYMSTELGFKLPAPHSKFLTDDANACNEVVYTS